MSQHSNEEQLREREETPALTKSSELRRESSSELPGEPQMQIEPDSDVAGFPAVPVTQAGLSKQSMAQGQSTLKSTARRKSLHQGAIRPTTEAKGSGKDHVQVPEDRKTLNTFSSSPQTADSRPKVQAYVEELGTRKASNTALCRLLTLFYLPLVAAGIYFAQGESTVVVVRVAVAILLLFTGASMVRTIVTMGKYHVRLTSVDLDVGFTSAKSVHIDPSSIESAERVTVDGSSLRFGQALGYSTGAEERSITYRAGDAIRIQVGFTVYEFNCQDPDKFLAVLQDIKRTTHAHRPEARRGGGRIIVA